jgi:type I restriction enzyme M protein
LTNALVSSDRAARLQDNANLIWGAAERMRGKITPADYGKVILPFTVLRRMDCLLEPHIKTIQALAASLETATDEARARIIRRKTGLAFYGLSDFTLATLLADPENIQENLKAYINGLSKNMRDVFIEHFGFFNWIDRLERQNLLYAMVKFFADKDLHPKQVSTIEMGYIFENLIRRFNETSNTTAGDHFTPREVIRLMTSLLFAKDGEQLASQAIAINILDPICGTGGMLATANDYLMELNANLRVNLFGQEVNPESFAICRSDMLLTGHSPDNIQIGNTLNDDQFRGQTFTYGIGNPPYGVDYSEEYDDVKAEHEQGEAGRFAPGIPRKSDGQLLFLLHMLSKLPADRPGRIAVIMNGSPLFNGDAGGGESEIRRALMENDQVDAIIALPTDLFYNTGIATYVWIVTNRKATADRGKVRLIDATNRWSPMRKSLGSKRRELSDDHISQIANLYLGHEEDETVKVFAPQDFGYRKLFIDRPLRLDVDLTESDPGRFRNSSELDDYFRWMAATFGEACDQRLEEIKDEVIEHVEEQEGLALLRDDENAAKSEISAVERRCKRLLRPLLSAEEHAERRALVDLIRGLREQGQATWMDYNAFVAALKTHARSTGESLGTARLKVIRAWVTATNPEAEPVIDKDVTKKEQANERLGFYPVGGKVITYERDSDLADTERVPLDRDIIDYFEAEVLPHVADAWINPTKRDAQDGQLGIVGYEINFNRYFYQYQPPRPLAEIDAELKTVEREIAELLAEVAE